MPSPPELGDRGRRPGPAEVLRRAGTREARERDGDVAPPGQQQREEERDLADEHPEPHPADGVAASDEHVAAVEDEQQGRERELEPSPGEAPEGGERARRWRRSGAGAAAGREGRRRLQRTRRERREEERRAEELAQRQS